MANFALAERMLMTAHEMCPVDPAVCHELGACVRPIMRCGTPHLAFALRPSPSFYVYICIYIRPSPLPPSLHFPFHSPVSISPTRSPSLDLPYTRVLLKP